MRYQETDDVHDRPKSGRPRTTTARDDSLLVQLSKARTMSTASQHQDASEACFVKNCTSDSCSQWSPWSYCCPETRRKVGQQKSGEKCIFQMNSQLSSVLSATNIVDNHQGPVWTHGSPRGQIHLEVERLWFGVTSNTEVTERSVRWMVTLIVPNINSFLPPTTIPNYKRGQIFQQDGAPCHISGSTMKFLRGKKINVLQGWPSQSPDINIIEHIWGRMKEEAWRTKPKNLEKLWHACKAAFHAIPDDFINKLYDSLPNRMATVLQAKGTHTIY